MTQIQAMLCAFAAFFCWVLFDVNSKLVAQAGGSPLVIMAIFGIVGVLVTVGVAVGKRDLSLLRSRNPRAQMVICLAFVTSSYVNVLALRHLPLMVFYLIVFAAPLIIAVVSALLQHEKLTVTKIACLIIGFLGIVLVLLPRLTSGGESIGYIAVGISVVAFVTRAITIRRFVGGNTMESILFFSALAIGCVGIVGGIAQNNPLPEGKFLAMTVAASGIGLLGHFLYNTALKHTVSTNVAQLHYTQLFWGGVLAYLIWHDVPSVNLVAGSVLIIGAGIVTARQAQASMQAQK